jgi:hypothetical protein
VHALTVERLPIRLKLVLRDQGKLVQNLVGQTSEEMKNYEKFLWVMQQSEIDGMVTILTNTKQK